MISGNEVKEGHLDEIYLNTRASYLCGQDIYGDAILATIGYLWKSYDLFHEDVSSRTYYRFLLLSLFSVAHIYRFLPCLIQSFTFNHYFTVS